MLKNCNPARWFKERYFAQVTLKAIWLLLVSLQGLLMPLGAHALPAFARQTGQNCVACHAGGQFPELTPYGRLFKLTGYTLGTRNIPLAVMGVASYSRSNNPDPADPAFAKDAAALFQTASVFVAGKVTDNVGLFAQATFDNYDHQSASDGEWAGKTHADNVDVRYADRFVDADRDLIVGLSFNNNPSVADVWNTAPAWIAYVPSSPFGVSGPAASSMITQLGQQAAGLGGYAYWNKLVYLEASAYRTANGIFSFMSHGIADADQTKLKGLNPYVRLALNHEWGPHNAMVGMFAMNSDIYPDNQHPTGPTTRFRDRGIDAQYQYLLDPHTVTAQLSWIHESIGGGDASGYAANASNSLRELKLKASYIYRAKYGTSLGYFSTTGSQDATLYASNANLSPDSRGWVPEVFWMPYQNLRVGAQYFYYNKFNGASTNYDGNGRNAKDNDTLFIYAWSAF